MIQKTIIFDFDGTIADTLGILLSIYNDAAYKFGCNQILDKDIERLRSTPQRKLLKEYGVKPYKIPIMALYIRGRLKKHIIEVEPIKNMPLAISSLKQNGHSLGILSSNSKANIEQFLEQSKMIDYFDFIYTSKNIFGKDKAINKIVKEHGLIKKKIYYVGDEIRDVRASKKARIKVVAVSWGFNSKAMLAKGKPFAVADKPQDLTKILNS